MRFCRIGYLGIDSGSAGGNCLGCVFGLALEAAVNSRICQGELISMGMLFSMRRTRSHASKYRSLAERPRASLITAYPVFDRYYDSFHPRLVIQSLILSWGSAPLCRVAFLIACTYGRTVIAVPQDVPALGSHTELTYFCAVVRRLRIAIASYYLIERPLIRDGHRVAQAV